MKTNVVNWFEVPVLDIARARKFYQNILGYAFEEPMPMGPVTFCFFKGGQTLPGATGALALGQGYVPSDKGSTVFFHAGPDLKVALDKVEKEGGKIIMPKMGIGEWGFIAKIVDTEGNLVALHSEK